MHEKQKESIKKPSWNSSSKTEDDLKAQKQKKVAHRGDCLHITTTIPMVPYGYMYGRSDETDQQKIVFQQNNTLQYNNSINSHESEEYPLF